MVKLLRGPSLTMWIGAIALLAMQPTLAQEVVNRSTVEVDSSAVATLTENIPPDDAQAEAIQLRDIERAATAVDEWLAQIAQAKLVEIVSIQIDTTVEGITLQLETNGELPIPATSITGNTVIADIPNAVLVLPDEDEFASAEPIEGIALVSITNLPNNRVRVAIAGTEAPPTVEVRSETTGLVLSVAPGTETETTTDEDAIQILVTGEQEEDYFVPDASNATRTDTPILDVPASIQVIPRQVLEDQQIIRIDDAFRNASAVVGTTDYLGANQLTIRGFPATGGL